MKKLLLLALFYAVFSAFLVAQTQFYFTANPNNPMLQASEQETWDDGGVFTASAIFQNSTFNLFYSGWKGEFGSPISIGLAESEDGFNFSKVSNNSALFSADGSGFDAYAVSNPVATHFESLWTLYYAAMQSSTDEVPKAIGRATSDFVEGPYSHAENPVLETGSNGEWDSHLIMPTSVIYSNGTYFLYYLGADSYPNGNSYIGLATSTDGLTWTKYDDPSTAAPPYAESDPVLMPGSTGSWDDGMLWGCSVHHLDTGFEMFYCGFSFNSGGGIGYAITTDGIAWTKAASQNPLFKWSDDPYATSHDNWVVEIPAVIYNESVAYMYYDYGPMLNGIGMAVSPLATNIIHVPTDQPTIQQGIDAATDGDIVLVDEGTYLENIRFKGKAITVASNYILDGDSSHIVNTIIDGSQPADPDSAAAVMFVNGEDTTSVIRGFTITGGTGVFNTIWQVKAGGGIFCWNAGCKILDNIITGNHVEDEDKAGGAGLQCGQDAGEDNFIIIKNNYVGYNTSLAHGFSAFGGGLSILTNFNIENNLIDHNSCTNTYGTSDGGGIEIEALPGISPSGVVKSNIIRNNELISKSHVIGVGLACYGLQNVEITDNLIEHNTGSADTNSRGAGIWIRETTNCLIKDNIIQYNELNGNTSLGGGIFGVQNKTVYVSQNTVSNNVCNSQNGSWGGGIGTYDIDTIFINSNLFENNLCNSEHSQSGGGGINLLMSGKTIIKDNGISNNSINLKSGFNSWGGGILIDKATDTVYIQNNIINNNYLGDGATGHGGGICFYGTNDITAYINSNLITNNFSDYGGGGLCTRNTYKIFIENNLFDKNESSRYGGAIMFYESVNKTTLDEYSHPVIANNTFTRNSSEYGGAIYSRHDDEVPVVFNSIFWMDSAVYSQDIYNWGGTEIPVYNNLIDTEKIITPWTGAENILCSPTFLNDSLHLHFDSQCLNAGTSFVYFIDQQYNCPATDFDGDERPYNGTNPDIGADEAPYMFVNFESKYETKSKSLTVYPNPFTFSTQIAYELSSPQLVSISIFNHLGELVGVLLNEHQPKGRHSLDLHTTDLSTGVYFCVIKTKSGTQTTKMIKLK